MSFNQQCLDAHNMYRAKHKSPPMKLDPEICNFSQSYANKLASTGGFQHSNHETYGENLYYFSSSNPNYTLNGKEAVDSWYNEIKDFRFGTDGFKNETGHFTQVVWTDSIKLGVGVAKSGGKTVVVCNYYPKGNYTNQFNKKVPPVGGF